MRIAFLTTEFGALGPVKGGLGYYLARVVPLLAEAGHECEVFLCSGKVDCGASEVDFEGARVRVLSAAALPLDAAVPRQIREHIRSAWTLAESISAASCSKPFDVIQVANFGVPGLFLDLDAPVVMRFSSHAPTWHQATGSPPTLRTTLAELLQRRAILAADGHFAPSSFVAELVAEELGITVRVVRPPIPGRVRPDQWDVGWVESVAKSGVPYIVHAGQLGRAKGTDIVLAAAERFLRCSDLHLHLCGRDAGAGTKIERLRRRFPSRVHCHQMVSQARLHPLMAGAAAVVCPSRADNLPNVQIEAMALGATVIGVRGASIDELIQDEESGVLVPPADSAALARAIMRVASDGPSSLGGNARCSVESLLDSRASLQAHLAAYANVRQPTASRTVRDRKLRQVLLDVAAITRLLAYFSSESPPSSALEIGRRLLRTVLRRRSE